MPSEIFAREDVDRVLQGRIAPVHLPFTYRAGLLGVGIALVLLQLAYVAMVVLAAALTILYILAIPAIVSAMHVN
jgi:hypothetical protein